MTRIIAGAARGRQLKVPPAGTRPTSDRVREALFSSLDSAGGYDTVLDLYAGSGALGLEALSRGARRVTLVERDRRTAAIIEANATAVGLPGAEVVASDVGSFLARPAEPAYDLVFLDPPYDLSEEDLAGDLAALERWLLPDGFVVVERSSRSPEPSWPKVIDPLRGKRYGETALWYGRRNR